MPPTRIPPEPLVITQHRLLLLLAEALPALGSEEQTYSDLIGKIKLVLDVAGMSYPSVFVVDGDD